MKKLSFSTILLVVCLLAVSALALTIASESKTKGTITLSVQYLDQIRFRSSAAATVQFNGTGSAYPIAANTDYTWPVALNTSSMVFNITSSATPTTIYSIR